MYVKTSETGELLRLHYSMLCVFTCYFKAGVKKYISRLLVPAFHTKNIKNPNFHVLNRRDGSYYNFLRPTQVSFSENAILPESDYMIRIRY